MKTLLFLVFGLLCSLASAAVEWRIVPIKLAADALSHVDATYVKEGPQISLKVSATPLDRMIGEFRSTALHVHDHAVSDSKRDQEFFALETFVRRDTSVEKVSQFGLNEVEIPKSYIAVYYVTPSSEEQDAVIFCIPIGLILEACDERLAKLKKPRQESAPPAPSGDG